MSETDKSFVLNTTQIVIICFFCLILTIFFQKCNGYTQSDPPVPQQTSSNSIIPNHVPNNQIIIDSNDTQYSHFSAFQARNPNNNNYTNTLKLKDYDLQPIESENEDIKWPPQRSRIVIASFRLPIIRSRDNNTWHIEFQNEMKYLSYLGLDELSPTEYDIVFVGWPGIYCDSEDDRDTLEDALYELKYQCYPVFFRKPQITLIETYCESILSPVFNHNKKPMVQLAPNNRQYVQLNYRYAQKTIIATDDADTDTDTDTDRTLLCFVDYHLLMAPYFVRRELPYWISDMPPPHPFVRYHYHGEITSYHKSKHVIGLFLQHGFPSPQIFNCLPSSKEILKGILASDILGFHEYRDRQRFLSTSKIRSNLDCDQLSTRNPLTFQIDRHGKDLEIVLIVGVNVELLTYGFIKKCWSCKELCNTKFPPLDIIKMISVWYSDSNAYFNCAAMLK